MFPFLVSCSSRFTLVSVSVAVRVGAAAFPLQIVDLHHSARHAPKQGTPVFSFVPLCGVFVSKDSKERDDFLDSRLKTLLPVLKGLELSRSRWGFGHFLNSQWFFLFFMVFRSARNEGCVRGRGAGVAGRVKKTQNIRFSGLAKNPRMPAKWKGGTGENKEPRPECQ